MGRGNFSKVYECKRNSKFIRDEKLAVRIISKDFIKNYKHGLEGLINEI